MQIQPKLKNDDGFRPAIILPTYNNFGTLPDVCRRCDALNLPMIVVDDGSTDGTSTWLAQRTSPIDDDRRFVFITHKRNQGKADALRSGFAAAIRAGFTHAVTIDTDGQLDPECIPALLLHSPGNLRALVLGYRDDRQDDYPARSRFGRRLSNMAIRLECGARVADSQCGLRVYPLELIKRVTCRTRRYGFEAAIITLATWGSFPLIQVPIRCRYFSGAQRISHFRLWRDSVHGVLLHARLMMMKYSRKVPMRPTNASGDSEHELVSEPS
jgi:glycosyltransferase involved in cell wall biosynthesis